MCVIYCGEWYLTCGPHDALTPCRFGLVCCPTWTHLTPPNLVCRSIGAREACYGAGACETCFGAGSGGRGGTHRFGTVGVMSFVIYD